ncbi:MAG: LacI family transcriptional regulator, partial [Flavonifractor plautii]
QPTIEMGRRAADTLIRAIVGKPIETKNIHLQPKLVVRGSVKTIYGERILYV